jgi:hypothetical protein
MMATPNLTHILTLRAYMSRDSASSAAALRGEFALSRAGHLKGVDGTAAEELHVDFSLRGADWLVFDEKTNIAHLELRANCKDQNGDGFFIYYIGVLEIDDIGIKFNNWSLGVQTTKSTDHHWFTNPVIETSSKSVQVEGRWGPLLDGISQVKSIIGWRLNYLLVGDTGIFYRMVRNEPLSTTFTKLRNELIRRSWSCDLRNNCE